MNVKKLFMIFILILFIIIIGIALKNINNKSVEKVSQSTENTDNTILSGQTTEADAGDSKVRKSTETVNADTENILEITDNYFIEQTNDVYLNLEDYVGKTIKIQGLIYSYEDTNGDICYAVVRNTPGCCGNDGLAGLDIRYTEDYPEENTWVEVVGVMGKDTVFDSEIPAIQVTSLQETEKGTTFVTN